MSILRGTSVILLILGYLGNNHHATAEAQRHILINRAHYETEKTEALATLHNLAMRICQNHTEEVQKKIDKYKTCALAIDEDTNTMCQVIEELFKTCIPPVINYFEECVPEKSKGLPTYAMETARNLVKYICDDSDGSHLLELGNPCIKDRNHIDSRRCLKRFNNEIMNKYNHHNPPEKDKICIFIKDFQSCFDSHVDRFCKDNITREAYKKMYNVFVCT